MSLKGDMIESIDKIKMEIIEQREEILRAFIAKYGFDPDDCVQILDMSDYESGIIRWRIEKKVNEKKRD